MSSYPTNPFKAHPKNHNGRDFVLGEPLNSITRLQAFMRMVAFKPQSDRLFQIAGFLDLHQQPELLNAILNRPWFHALNTHHEQNLVQVNHSKLPSFQSSTAEDKNNQILLNHPMLQQQITELPLLMEVATNAGLIGLAHSASVVRKPWHQLIKSLSKSSKQAKMDWMDQVLWPDALLNAKKQNAVLNRPNLQTKRLKSLHRLVVSQDERIHQQHTKIHYLPNQPCSNKGLQGYLLQIQPELRVHRFLSTSTFKHVHYDYFNQ